MSSGLSIPKDDLKEFASLPEHVQNDARLWVTVLSRIFRAENKAREIRAQRHDMAWARGFSKSNIKRKFYAVLNGGNWRCLVNYAKVDRVKGAGKTNERGIGLR